MKNRAFTLVEIIVTVVIVGILATVGLPIYQNTVESSKEQVCQTNLLTLQKAVEMYTFEHDTVPGSLSELKPETVLKAYAGVMSGKGAWKKRLAYLIVEGPQWGLAYAASYGMPNLRCPGNTDTSSTQISYGLNKKLAGISSSEYKALSDNVVVVADSEARLFDYSTILPDEPAHDKGDKKVTSASYLNTINKINHKKYKVLSSPDYYLKGVDKIGRIGKITSTSWSIDKNKDKKDKEDKDK